MLLVLPASTEFWPTDITVPLPKSTRFPKQPQPTEHESKLVAELMEQKGYKVINKFWVWQALVMAHRCTAGMEGIETAQGMFQGFLRARIIPLQIANWGGGGEQELEDEKSQYETMRKMDMEAPEEY